MAERMTTHPAPPERELVALLELSERATPGIWEMYGGTNHARVQTADVIVCDGSPPHFMGKEDAKFIAALVNWFRQTAPTLPGAGGGDDTARLDYIERTFGGCSNQERYLPLRMLWGKGANGRTLREACDKYMARDAALPPQQGG